MDRRADRGRRGLAAGRHHENAVQLLTTNPTARNAATATIRVSSTRRTLHRWIETGSRSGTSARNCVSRSRPSSLSSLRSCVGLATPRAAAKASAISASVKYRSACRYTR